MSKGVNIRIRPFDDDHVCARLSWREQDVGGGTLIIEVPVRNLRASPKSDREIEIDARALAVRFARAFADTIES